MPDDEIMLMDSPFPPTRNISAEEAVQYIVSRKWQSIETAPKDETEVFLFCPLSTDSKLQFGRWFNGEWVDSFELHHKMHPTHWMPLDWFPAPK